MTGGGDEAAFPEGGTQYWTYQDAKKKKKPDTKQKNANLILHKFGVGTEQKKIKNREILGTQKHNLNVGKP